jgi:hypothetical protein
MAFSAQTTSYAGKQHETIARLTEAILRLGHPGDTLAEAIERIGPQHPLVRQRDFAVQAYRRSMPWNSGVRNS